MNSDPRESQRPALSASPEVLSNQIRAFFEYSPGAHFIISPGGVVLAANRAAEELTGFARAELVGKSILEVHLIPAGQVDRVLLHIRRSAAGDMSEPEEFSLIRKDGSRLAVEVQSFPMESRDSAIALCIRDVSPLRRAETEARERRERAQLLHATVLELGAHGPVHDGDLPGAARFLTEKVARATAADEVGVWLADRQNRVICVDQFNPSTHAHSGGMAASVEDFEDSPNMLVSPIYRLETRIGWIRLERRGADAAVWQPEEREFSAEIANQMAQVILHADRLRSEAALKQSKVRLGRALRMAVLCHWEFEPHTGLFECSEEMFSIFGVEPSGFEATRTNFLAMIHPDDRAGVEDNMHAVIHLGQAIDSTYRIVRPDGGIRHLREHAEVETDGDGRVILALGILQDMTEHRRLEERLQLAEKLDLVARIAGGIAHDFNNLLTVINGYTARLLKMTKEGEPSRAAMVEIQKAGERAAVLSQQLMAIGRKQVIEQQRVDVNAAVRESESLVCASIGERTELATTLHPGPLIVQTGAGQVQQILLNLALNSKDAMPRGGVIEVETSRIDLREAQVRGTERLAPGAYAVISVKDNGDGMDEDTLAHLFEPFFTTKTAGRGTGLGMSTVYAVVKQSGGSIEVRSESGRGTTVKVYFPCVAVDTPCLGPAPDATRERRLSRLFWRTRRERSGNIRRTHARTSAGLL